MTVTLFIPCFVDLMFPRVGISIVEILEKLGHKVDYPEELTCCGQPAFNSGYWDEARAVALPVLRRLQNAEAVVIASGSCGAMLKVFYPQLFAGTEHEEAAKELSAQVLRIFRFPRDQTRRDRSRRAISAQGHVSRRLPRPARTRHQKARARIARPRSRPGTRRDARGRNLLRFRRHVRREVPDDLHRDGRSEMRLRRRDRRGIHRLQRFQLPDAHAGLARQAGQASSRPFTSRKC